MLFLLWVDDFIQKVKSLHLDYKFIAYTISNKTVYSRVPLKKCTTMKPASLNVNDAILQFSIKMLN